jgi:hypothetical protein
MAQPLDPAGFQHAVVDVHGNYRSKRLLHEPPDELISDAVTARVLRPHLVRSGFFFSVFMMLAFFALLSWVIGVIAKAAGTFDRDSREFGDSMFSLTTFLLVLLILLIIAWLVSLFLPVREPIAEYGLLIEGRAAADAVAYWWIMETARSRQSPFRMQVVKVRKTPTLLLSHDRVHGMVVVRPVGTDLYLGWTMWRTRSTMVLIAHLLRDMFQASGLATDVRAAWSRALRELLHSVTREGVQAAILRPPVQEDVARAHVDQLPSLDVLAAPPPGFDPVTGLPNRPQPVHVAPVPYPAQTPHGAPQDPHAAPGPYGQPGPYGPPPAQYGPPQQ